MKIIQSIIRSEEVRILGLDIGGAFSKAALIQFENKKTIKSNSYIEYFPFWEESINQFSLLLKNILMNIFSDVGIRAEDIKYIAVTMTAELSDAFQTKKEGVLTILKELSKVFEIEKLRFITTQNKFIEYEEAQNNPYLLAAANWVSTALFLGHFISNCILIDSGSTTIDVIPIHKSIPVSVGKNDIERIVNHELIYTGGLRATIPSITHFVPYKNQMVRISFEKFALISDVHRILNNISEEEYINDTADNRSKSLDNCYARLSRIICMDIEGVSKKELDLIASYIYRKQLELVKDEIKEFLENLKRSVPELYKSEPLFVITGLSAKFLIEKVLRELNYNKIENYENITNIPNNINSSAFAVAGTFYHQLINSE